MVPASSRVVLMPSDIRRCGIWASMMVLPCSAVCDRGSTAHHSHATKTCLTAIHYGSSLEAKGMSLGKVRFTVERVQRVCPASISRSLWHIYHLPDHLHYIIWGVKSRLTVRSRASLPHGYIPHFQPKVPCHHVSRPLSTRNNAQHHVRSISS